jgi:thermitase
MIPDDRLYPKQWAWDRLGARAAWECIEPKAYPITVAVVDTGVADNHAALRPYLLKPRTVIGETRDDDDHGTLVTGTIVAATLGVAAPANLRILPVKFCSQQVFPSPGYGALAITEATKARVDVIVLAWDVGYDTPELEKAIKAAGSAGVVVVIAAGNESLDNDKYRNWPANYGRLDHVITVMATDRNDERASFSSYGAKTVHVAAPGTEILSTVPYLNGRVRGSDIPYGYRMYRGSSAAAAHVAGLVALIRMLNPRWSPRQIKEHVGATATPVSGLHGLCVSEGVASYERAICGSINILPPKNIANINLLGSLLINRRTPESAG